MVAIRKVLNRKGHEVWTIHPNDTVFDAIEKMADKNIGALVVIEDDKIVGMFTERHSGCLPNAIMPGKFF